MPLLLLRSKRSITTSVRWFVRDWFDFEGYDGWSCTWKRVWLGISALVGFATSWWLSSHLASAQLGDQSDQIATMGALVDLMAMAWVVVWAVAGAYDLGYG